MDADGGMVLLLLLLGAILSYLFFSKGFWLDKWARDSKDERESWNGSDIQPDYNTGQENESPFDDPEVPSRPKKSKKRKKKTVVPRKRGYLPVVKKQKKKKVKKT